jgi:hypothetical protein
MRKAEESAVLLRSVVLPLEEEISNLKKNSELSKKRIKNMNSIYPEM